jgi:PAS domain S-box-containing protein
LIFSRIRSFQSKLLIVMVICCAIASLLIGSTLIIRSFLITRTLVHEDLQTQADVIAIQSLAALDFKDRKAGAETLAALRADPEILAAALFDENDAEFASYQRDPNHPVALELQAAGIESRKGKTIFTKRLVDSGKLSGTLVMAHDQQMIQQRMINNLLISLALTLVVIGISIFLAFRLQRVLSKPVGELVHAARRVSETKNYAIRATKYSDDEFGELTEAFNTMLSQIERQAADLESANQRFRIAVEAAPNALIMVDEAGVMVMVNAQAEKMFGYSREELVGQSVDMLMPQRMRAIFPTFRQQFFDAPIARPMEAGRDLFGLRKSGAEFPVEIGLNPIRTDSGLRVLSSILDITERKRVEAERQQLLESERAARGEAERASRMKDEFVATLSHELRTPLTAILGWAQMLRKSQQDDGETSQGLEVIERNARIQTRIIEDLLDVSRIISGKIRLDVQPVDLNTVIEAALATVRPAAEGRSIRLQTILDPNVGLVRGDPNRLQQVIWNLLSNAIKFTNRGGRVQIAMARVNSHVEISVSDTGQGIDPQFLPYVFERFRQADSSTTRKHTGLGLGLAIVKQLVELHGGTVRAMSPGEDQGSTFIIELPLAVSHGVKSDEDREQPVTPRAVPFDNGPISLRGVRVVVVDDEADARELVSRILSHREAEVRTFASADDALKAIGPEHFDVLVSDIGMPGKDGYELIREIRGRSFDQGGSVPAVALTAFARSEDRTRALLAGFQMHVAKPVEPSELIATVGSLAGLTRASSHDPGDPPTSGRNPR